MIEDLHKRIALGLFGVVFTFAVSAAGLWWLGGGRWTFSECLYMAVITLTTVGYGEVLDGFNEVAYAREFTILFIVTGMGVILYFVSSLTAFIIEGDLRRALENTRMRKRLSQIRDHVIVCGAGNTGRHVIAELIATNTPIVAIDIEREYLEELYRRHKVGFLYLCGDATDDQVLDQAGLSRARGLVAALANDKDNLYLVVSARQGHPDLAHFRIVARGIDVTVLDKLRKAGADAVVSPNFIGGMRMASEMLRPTVVRFLDEMLHEEQTTRIEEVKVSPGSIMVGRTVLDAMRVFQPRFICVHR